MTSAELGGFDFFFSLQRECAQRRLQSHHAALQGLVQRDPTAPLDLRLVRVVEGPGLVRVDAENEQDQALTLWLFPQHLPAYLEYKPFLALTCGNANRCLLHCRESAQQGHWFIEKIGKE
jgi:hypothetical protein